MNKDTILAIRLDDLFLRHEMLQVIFELFVRQVCHDLQVREGNAAVARLFDMKGDNRFRLVFGQLLQALVDLRLQTLVFLGYRI